MGTTAMNIAMISYHTCPLAVLGGKHTGGMNVYVRELTRSMGRLGVHVDVFTRSENEHVPHVIHELGYGNRVVHIPAGPEVPLPKAELPRYLPEFSEGILRFATQKGLRYDLVHAHYWLSGPAGMELKERWNVPLVTMFHTLALLKNRVLLDPAEREPEERIEGERRAVASSERIVAATRPEADALVKLYGAEPERVEVIPPGVDVSRFYPIPADEAKAAVDLPAGKGVILFVGRIEPLKGVETLLHAFQLLERSGLLANSPHVLAIIGGDTGSEDGQPDAEMARLQRLAEQLGIHHLVMFMGKRGQETLPYYYSAAEMVVVPSHYESFGMVALEAMACGTPVIATRVGGLARLVQNGRTGFVVPDSNPQLLAEAIERLVRDPALRARIGQEGTRYAQRFAWERISRRVLKLYEGMLAGQVAAPPPLGL